MSYTPQDCKKLDTTEVTEHAHTVVKNLPVRQETWVRSLGQKDPLEKEMAIQPSILAWEIPWREKPGGLQPMRSQKSQT